MTKDILQAIVRIGKLASKENKRITSVRLRSGCGSVELMATDGYRLVSETFIYTLPEGTFLISQEDLTYSPP